MFIHNKLDCCYCLTRAEQVLLFRLQPGNNILNTHLFNKHSWPVKDEREAGDFGRLERTYCSDVHEGYRNGRLKGNDQ